MEIQYIIDCDADPFVPSRYKVWLHKKGGKLTFDPAKIKLYLSPSQQSGKYINMDKLCNEMVGEPVFNANVLDFLLKNPNLISEEWKKDEKGNTRYTLFWGTIYYRFRGSLYVRYLYWNGKSWDWDFYWLVDGWNSNDPAAVIARY